MRNFLVSPSHDVQLEAFSGVVLGSIVIVLPDTIFTPSCFGEHGLRPRNPPFSLLYRNQCKRGRSWCHGSPWLAPCCLESGASPQPARASRGRTYSWNSILPVVVRETRFGGKKDMGNKTFPTTLRSTVVLQVYLFRLEAAGSKLVLVQDEWYRCLRK